MDGSFQQKSGVVTTPLIAKARNWWLLEKIIMIERSRSCRPDPGMLIGCACARPTWHGGPVQFVKWLEMSGERICKRRLAFDNCLS
jgi:hypothetical protein